MGGTPIAGWFIRLYGKIPSRNGWGTPILGKPHTYIKYIYIYIYISYMKFDILKIINHMSNRQIVVILISVLHLR